MSLVNWLPNILTQSRVFISGNEIQGMVTYIPVGGGAGEMAMGGIGPTTEGTQTGSSEWTPGTVSSSRACCTRVT